jgi:hypothetical protein
VVDEPLPNSRDTELKTRLEGDSREQSWKGGCHTSFLAVAETGSATPCKSVWEFWVVESDVMRLRSKVEICDTSQTTVLLHPFRTDFIHFSLVQNFYIF